MIKHECVDEERWISEETFKKTLAVYQVLPGPRGARALRLLRAHPRRQARRLSRRARLHAAGLRPDAGAIDPLRRGRPRWTARRGLLRAVGGGRGDHRAGARAPQRHLHHRCRARGDRRRGVCAHGLRRRDLRPRPARRGRRLRAVDATATRWFGRAESFSFAPAAIWVARRRDHVLADRDDLLGGPEDGPADVRRRLHRDPLPAGERRRFARLAHRQPVRRRAGDERHPPGPADHLLDIRRLHRGRPRRRAGDDPWHLPPRVHLPDLLSPGLRRGRREPPDPRLPARRRRGSHRPDRRGNRGHRRHEHRRRPNRRSSRSPPFLS